MKALATSFSVVKTPTMLHSQPFELCLIVFNKIFQTANSVDDYFAELIYRIIVLLVYFPPISSWRTADILRNSLDHGVTHCREFLTTASPSHHGAAVDVVFQGVGQGDLSDVFFSLL